MNAVLLFNRWAGVWEPLPDIYATEREGREAMVSGKDDLDLKGQKLFRLEMHQITGELTTTLITGWQCGVTPTAGQPSAEIETK